MSTSIKEIPSTKNQTFLPQFFKIPKKQEYGVVCYRVKLAAIFMNLNWKQGRWAWRRRIREENGKMTWHLTATERVLRLDNEKREIRWTNKKGKGYYNIELKRDAWKYPTSQTYTNWSSFDISHMDDQTSSRTDEIVSYKRFKDIYLPDERSPPRQKKLKKIRLESKEGGRLQGGE
jgi:hypothetical protein